MPPFAPLATSSAPIQGLPPEVLLKIFKACCTPNHSYAPNVSPTVLELVCTQWRDVAHANSCLWSSMTIEPKWLPTTVDRWLLHCRTQLLSVSFHSGFAALQPLLLKRDRWRSMEFYITDSTQTVAVLSGHCPQLVSLNIVIDQGLEHTPFHLDAPQLQSLRLWRVGNLQSITATTLHNLTSIEIIFCTDSHTFLWPTLLPQCQNLRYMNFLFSPVFGDREPLSTRLSTTALPRLTGMVLGHGGTCLALRDLQAPNLSYLGISYTNFRSNYFITRPSFTSFLARSLSLTTLSVTVEGQTNQRAPNIQLVLAALPNLTVLKIDNGDTSSLMVPLLQSLIAHNPVPEVVPMLEKLSLRCSTLTTPALLLQALESRLNVQDTNVSRTLKKVAGLIVFVDVTSAVACSWRTRWEALRQRGLHTSLINRNSIDVTSLWNLEVVEVDA